MALDGITIAALTGEFSRLLTGGRISKIAMPEKDELLLTIKNQSQTYRLLISAGASLPLIYISPENKTSPQTAPSFCMLLRKYIGTARILSIRQSGLERIIIFELEHRNDMGDISTKRLVIELMGKYSNIIFTDERDTILDAIRHVPANVSSLREVLPGRRYFLPEELVKADPLTETYDGFCKRLSGSHCAVYKAIYTIYSGISPLISGEICFRAGVDSDKTPDCCDDGELNRLFDAFSSMMNIVKTGSYSPNMILNGDIPEEYAPVRITSLGSERYRTVPYDSMSMLLFDFCAKRDAVNRIRQKSSDLRRIVNTAHDRAVKKFSLQENQLKDCEKKDRYKVYGDLLNTYGYSLRGGEKSFTCMNYYDDNREVTIPLDETLSARDNAVRYYDRYAKLRRTQAALSEEILRTKADIEHLESISLSLDIASGEADLAQIRNELESFGYIKKHTMHQLSGKAGKKDLAKGGQSGRTPKSEPLHFVSSDGYDIYVGKNNYQNEEITFKMASGNDWWFHAKGVPGSHVIVRCGADAGSLPDRVFEEAAALAAYYSSVSDSAKVDVDYTQKKNLRRVSGGAPGFVIYHTNYSMSIAPGQLPVS